MTDRTEKTPNKSVDLTKGAGGSRPAPADPQVARPRQIVLATAGLVTSGVFAIIAALTLWGVRPWIRESVAKSDAKAKPPIKRSATEMNDHVSQILTSQLVANVVLLLALGFIAYGVWRGRPWSRWAVVGIWVIGTYTGTLAGIASIFAAGASVPGPFKATAFISALALVGVVVLVNLRPSTEWFAAHRPPRPEGAVARPGLRDLFAPRGAGARRGATPAAQPSSPKTQQSRPAGAKPKSKARAEEAAVARGAELARSRAKASKSRRTES